MKQRKQHEWSVQLGLLLFLALAAYKCSGQGIRFNTVPGLVIATETNNPDELCLYFGTSFQSVQAENLRYAGGTLQKRLASAVQMADDAGVSYRAFLKESGMKDGALAHAYYSKCQELRLQFLAVLPERAFLELRHIVQYFK